MAVKISQGAVHTVPKDLRYALIKSPASLAAWEDITPLARNEWICWAVTVKQEKTRKNHIQRAIGELKGGKRRPCCWAGCIHRTDKQLSASVKRVLTKAPKDS